MQGIQAQPVAHIRFLHLIAVTPRFDVAGPQQPRFGNTCDATGVSVCFQDRSSESVLIHTGFDQTLFRKTLDPFIRFETDFLDSPGYDVIDEIVLRIIRQLGNHLRRRHSFEYSFEVIAQSVMP